MKKINFYVVLILVVSFISCKETPDKKEIKRAIETLRRKVDFYLAQDDFQNGIVYCDSILDLDSTNSFALFNKGTALSSLRKNTEAITLFNLVLSRDSTVSKVYEWRGFTLENMGDTIGAMTDYNKSIVLDSNDFRARNNRGNLFRKMGEYNEAENDFKAAFQIDSSSILLLNNWGLLQSNLGNDANAIFYYDKAIKIQQADFLFFDRAVVKFRMKLFDEAISDFSASISMNPNNALSYLYRGSTYGKIGKTDLMCSDLYQAAALGNPEAKQYIETYCDKTTRL